MPSALADRRLRELFRRIPKISVQGYDEARRVVFWNLASEELYGYTEEEALGRQLEDLIIPPEMGPEVVRAHAAWLSDGVEIPAGELVLRHKNGSPVPVFSSHLLQRNDAGGLEMYCVDIDLSKQKAHETELRYMATHDPLTELPNRSLLRDRLAQALARGRRDHCEVAVAYIDLDHFKELNDAHGHAAGDQVLCHVASQMQSVLRAVDTLARLGGDEFVAVIVGLSGREHVALTLDRLRHALATPMALEGQVVSVRACIGVATSSGDEAKDADLLLRQADLAMYQAKVAGKDRVAFFDADLDRWVRQRHERTSRALQALRQGELCLYYQPQVSLESGAVVGAEALVRWRHPQQGILPPADFLPYLEEGEPCVELGEWVLRTALKQWRVWHDEGLTLKVSVNMSGAHFQRPDFLSRLADILRECPDLPRFSLVLELLESSSLHSLERTAVVISACQAMGVAVAIDDFGTGYSSLSYLKQLPADVLKIDRSFVRDMLHDEGDRAILSGILHLGKAFRRTVIAEGVESEAQGRALMDMGCGLAQGFAISPPLAASAFAPWVRTWVPPLCWTGAG